MTFDSYVALGFLALTIFLSWRYFRRYALARPPIGVLNLWDVSIMAVAVVLIPYLDLLMPFWLAATLISLVSFSIIYMVVEAMVPTRWAIWLLAAGLTTIDLWAAFQFGPTSVPFFFINSAIQMVVVVGVTNLWAQSGLKARDLVILVSLIAIYDYVATVQTSLTDDLLNHLNHLPFSPWVGGIGIGDVLFASVFPLIMRKAFGRRAGIMAVVITLTASAIIIAMVDVGLVPFVPSMVFFAPLMVLQYLYWQRRQGSERTMWQYLQAEPVSVYRIAK